MQVERPEPDWKLMHIGHWVLKNIREFVKKEELHISRSSAIPRQSHDEDTFTGIPNQIGRFGVHVHPETRTGTCIRLLAFLELCGWRQLESLLSRFPV